MENMMPAYAFDMNVYGMINENPDEFSFVLLLYLQYDNSPVLVRWTQPCRPPQQDSL